MSQFLESIIRNLRSGADSPAFCISGKHYSYKELASTIATIQHQLQQNGFSPGDRAGILSNDDLPTYASVFAILFLGGAFVPVQPQHPASRNKAILEQAEIKLLLSSVPDNSLIPENDSVIRLIRTVETDSGQFPEFLIRDPQQTAYVLFTSGSTGVPKGVPLTVANLEAFLDAFFSMGFELSAKDRFLQMFDMTFDLSIMSYMAPLCIGACVYTVPFEAIKYMHVYRLLEEHNITFALLVPSIITHLRPYFEEIRLEHMRYSLFCGEALYEDVTLEWSRCIPNARVFNVYGPTEATIFCTSYPVRPDGNNKTLNGILSIGKAMKNTDTIITGDDNTPLPAGEKGELCLGGSQVTPGYWRNEKKNAEAFFTIGENRYYRTGDLCYEDESGDLFYSGRIDFQVKIQGFRVELGEIEIQARKYMNPHAVIAVATQNETAIWQIFLFIEGFKGDTKALQSHLKDVLPSYMLPSKIICIDTFPLNANGKVDRKALINEITAVNK